MRLRAAMPLVGEEGDMGEVAVVFRRVGEEEEA
jgi:hypothetical protein